MPRSDLAVSSCLRAAALAAVAASAACTSPHAAAAVATVGPAATGGVVSSFDDGMASTFGNDWRVVDDRQTGGKSSVTLERVSPGADGSSHAVRVAGKVVLADYPFPMAGLGLPLGKLVDRVPVSVDLSAFHGIQLWARGNGKKYMLKIQSTDIEDFNFFHHVFVPGPEWQLVRVPFADLEQFDWGEKKAWTGTSVNALFITNYGPPGEEFGDIDFTVDQVALY